MKHSLQRAMRFPPTRFLADVAQVYFRCHVSRAAAALAYFLILTFFPILICLSAFLARLNLDLSALLDEAGLFLPAGVLGIFEDYLTYVNGNLSTAMFWAGLITAVLFAAAALRGLMSTMAEIYGRPTLRGLWKMAASILFTLMMLVTIYLSLAVLVTGNWFFHLLGNLLHLEDLVSRFDTWQWLKYLILLAIVLLFFALLYRFAAPPGKPRPPVIPGALAASVTLAAASILFSVLMSRSTRYALVYGSLTSVIILLVWLYLMGNILILGNVINYVIYTHRLEKS